MKLKKIKIYLMIFIAFCIDLLYLINNNFCFSFIKDSINFYNIAHIHLNYKECGHFSFAEICDVN